MTVAGLVGIVGRSYAISYIDICARTKVHHDILRHLRAGDTLFNLLASYWLPFVYISIFIVGFSLREEVRICSVLSRHRSLSTGLSKVNGVIFPINYCIGCLNFVVNAVVMKVTGSLTGAYIVYLCLFLINILIVAKTEEGKRG